MSTGHSENKCSHLWLNLDEENWKEQFGKIGYRESIYEMIKMQDKLQTFMKDKRNVASPQSCENAHEQARWSMYYWGCATTEWSELLERFEDFKMTLIHKSQNTDGPFDHEVIMETYFEYIDIWHFLMNTALYLNGGSENLIKSLNKIPNMDADIFVQYAKSDAVNLANNVSQGDFHSIMKVGASYDNIKLQWSNICDKVGWMIDKSPFKTWKTYEKDVSIGEEELNQINSIFSDVIREFVKLGATIGVESFDIFTKLYFAKNQENFDRQNKGY